MSIFRTAELITSSNMSRAKRWCFTINNPNQGNLLTLENAGNNQYLDWMFYKWEVAPTTGTVHIQGTLCMKRRITTTELQQLVSGTVPLGNWLNPCPVDWETDEEEVDNEEVD